MCRQYMMSKRSNDLELRYAYIELCKRKIAVLASVQPKYEVPMQILKFAALCVFCIPSIVGQTQVQVSVTPTKVQCDETTPICTHTIINGFTYRTISTPQAAVTVSLADNGKYTRLSVDVTNAEQAQFDVIPSTFTVSVTAPKERILRMVPPEKIISSESHRAGWANVLNAMGAGMASRQVTTQTNSSGTVQTTGNDGAYSNGTYEGTSTSTTTVPDYAAQARANQNIAQRRAALAAHETELSQTILRANTVTPGKSVDGFVFFESEKHGELYVVDIPINATVYEFSIPRPKH